MGAPTLPFNLGQAVRRRAGAESVGLVIGIIFGSPDVVLVRWDQDAPTFEAVHELVTVFE
jgi:hypothetical protein